MSRITKAYAEKVINGGHIKTADAEAYIKNIGNSEALMDAVFSIMDITAGKLLECHRVKIGMTQEKLAEAVGFSSGEYYSKLINEIGNRKLNKKHIVACCIAMNLTRLEVDRILKAQKDIMPLYIKNTWDAVIIRGIEKGKGIEAIEVDLKDFYQEKLCPWRKGEE